MNRIEKLEALGFAKIEIDGKIKWLRYCISLAYEQVEEMPDAEWSLLVAYIEDKNANNKNLRPSAIKKLSRIADLCRIYTEELKYRIDSEIRPHMGVLTDEEFWPVLKVMTECLSDAESTEEGDLIVQLTPEFKLAKGKIYSAINLDKKYPEFDGQHKAVRIKMLVLYMQMLNTLNQKIDVLINRLGLDFLDEFEMIDTLISTGKDAYDIVMTTGEMPTNVGKYIMMSHKLESSIEQSTIMCLGEINPDDLMQVAGQKKADIPEPEDQQDVLETKLIDAVNDEDYETAAILRDQINKIRGFIK